MFGTPYIFLFKTISKTVFKTKCKIKCFSYFSSSKGINCCFLATMLYDHFQLKLLHVAMLTFTSSTGALRMSEHDCH